MGYGLRHLISLFFLNIYYSKGRVNKYSVKSKFQYLCIKYRINLSATFQNLNIYCLKKITVMSSYWPWKCKVT